MGATVGIGGATLASTAGLSLLSGGRGRQRARDILHTGQRILEDTEHSLEGVAVVLVRAGGENFG